MAISIIPYTPEHAGAATEFNRRLRAAGAAEDLVFYETSTPKYFPKHDGSTVYNELFVAVEGGAVRAGYALKHQRFYFEDGETRSVGYYHHALSEGIINKAYSGAGILLLRDALARQPLLYCLGMDGYDQPLPKMLKLLRWSDCLIPFFFRVAHPGAFLREVETVRRGAGRSFLLDIAAASGAGWLAFKGAQAWKEWRAPRPQPHQVEEVAEFGDWADPLWAEAREACVMTAVRDAETLRVLYPATDAHLTRLRLSAGAKVIGWAVVGERRKNAKFGNLRVGSIVDCMAVPGNATAVVRAAASALERRGMDVVVSSQSHQVWGQAFSEAGFFQGPSTFIFAASPKLAELISPFGEKKNRIHFTRADGDGLPRNF